MPITPPYAQDAAADPAWRTVNSKIICSDEQVPDPEPGHRVVQTHTPAGQRVALWQAPVPVAEPEPELEADEPAKPKRRRSRKTDEAIQGAA